MISSKCGASIADTDTLLPITAIFCQWEQFFWITVSSATEHNTDIHNYMTKQQTKTRQESIPVLHYPPDTDANIRLNNLGIWSIRPPLALSSFTTQQIHKFVSFFSPLTCIPECTGWPSDTRCSSDTPGLPEQRLQRSWRWAQSRSSPGRHSYHPSRRLLPTSGWSSTRLALWTCWSAAKGESGWCESMLQIRWGGCCGLM